jgi:hypothetical protein
MARTGSEKTSRQSLAANINQCLYDTKDIAQGKAELPYIRIEMSLIIKFVTRGAKPLWGAIM